MKTETTGTLGRLHAVRVMRRRMSGVPCSPSPPAKEVFSALGNTARPLRCGIFSPRESWDGNTRCGFLPGSQPGARRVPLPSPDNRSTNGRLSGREPQGKEGTMAKKKNVTGAVGKGGVNPAPTGNNHTVRVAAEQLVMVPIDELVPYANNAKIHGKEQIQKLRGSLREFGFVTPVLIDFDNNIIAGHGRVMAAREEGMDEVPCVMISNLTEAQRKAYILADNRMSEMSEWDLEALDIEVKGLQEMAFDVELIGFEPESLKEIQVSAHTRTVGSQTEKVEEATAEDDDYDGSVPEKCPYKYGDVFKLGRHLLVCGDCTSVDSAQQFAGEGTGGSPSH